MNEYQLLVTSSSNSFYNSQAVLSLVISKLYY